MLLHHTYRRLFDWMLICVCGLTSGLHAQIGGIAMEFPNADSITVAAGEPVSFELVARDVAGNVITNWDSVGTNVTLEITGSGAMSDSSMRTWNVDPDGYSWTRVHDGQGPLTPATDYTYLITKERFQDGRLPLWFVDTRVEYGVRLRVLPEFTALEQHSPPISILPAPFTNLLVEVTYAYYDGFKRVYRDRPFEIVCFPRDRYMNWVNDTIPVFLRTRFPETVLDPPPHPVGYARPSLADSLSTLYGPTAFYGSLTVTRIENRDPGQWIEVLCIDDTTVRAMSDTLFVHDHAPYPFEQYDPPDGVHVNLNTASPDSLMTFRWHPERPADPYSGAYQSRFDPGLYSDRVFYRVTFYDPSTLRYGGSSAWTTDTRDSSLSITAAEFTVFLQNAQPQWSGGPTELYWYAVATDTTYETPADSFTQDTIRGFRILVNAQTSAASPLPSVRTLVLQQNYPNPFNPTTTILYTLTHPERVSLIVTDLYGREVRRLLDGSFEEAGSHQVHFDAAGLPSGVYFYIMAADGQRLTKKMVVLR
ncbi:MAG: T9SS type A sorting domain-containing protein [Bacteroidetes bacterium]|nr:T9SS type A sorting domain-containing protein [Bacteroidota bacterium]